MAICQEAGLLESVKYGSYADLPTVVSAVLLTFESGSWLLHICPDDDTIRISSHGALDDLGFVFHDADSVCSQWRNLVGKSVLWVWILENQQGYVDGVQFSFADQGKELFRIQMIAAASHWQIHGWEVGRG